MFFSNEFDTDIGDERAFGNGASDENISTYHFETSYKYEFNSDEDLVKSRFFQECLKKSLAFKDEQIRQLQNELLKYLN